MNSPDMMIPSVTLGTTEDASFPMTVTPWKGEILDRCPVVTLELRTAGNRPWQSSDFLVLDFSAVMTSTVTLVTEFYTGDKLRFFIRNTLLGGRRVKSCCELRYLDSSRNYPRNLPGHFKCGVHGKPTDLNEVDRVLIHVMAARDFENMTVYDLYLTEKEPDLSVVGEPVVDRLGQSLHMDFKGKFSSEEEMRDYLRAQYQWAKNHQSWPQADYDRFGGWKKLHFGKTGRFYRHHDGKRWWLVDPDGNAFFSNGICYGHRAGIHGMVTSFENLFSWLPERDDPALGKAYTTADRVPEYVKRNGLALAKSKTMFNFARANMMRAFGESWHEAYMTISAARLKAWGFNTISVCVNDYEDENTVAALHRMQMPYCYTLKNFPRTETMLYRDFPDVFSPEYETRSAEFARQLGPFADDPFFIGYFITNEPEWMFQKDMNLAERTLAAAPHSATADAILAFLREAYSHIDQLNRAWGTDFADFDALRGKAYLNERSDAAKADFRTLRDLLMDRYCDVPARALRKAAPNAMSLGMRYSAVKHGDFAGNGRFDIFSFNCYRRDPAEMFATVRDSMDGPFLVGEWHYGAAESGLYSGALINATTQKERGKACADYMCTAFENTSCVGTHYFELNDQPLTGRFDGENMNVGLVNVCNVPYTDCVEELAAMNARMYPILNGDEQPEKIQWKYQYRF